MQLLVRSVRSLAGGVFPSLAHLGLTCAVMALAQAIYVLFGFGFGLVAVGLLAMVLQVRDVVVLLLLVGLPAEAAVVWSSRRVIGWRGVALICAGLAVGVPAGTAILQRGEPSLILVLLGGFLVIAGLAFLLLREGLKVRWPRWVAPLAGAIAGLLAGLFGTGGPPVILYYRLAGVDKQVFRSSLMAVFLLVTLLRLPVYAAMGLLTRERLWAALLVLPAVAAGALIGNRIHLEIAERTFQRLVAAALAAIGVLLLARSLW